MHRRQTQRFLPLRNKNLGPSHWKFLGAHFGLPFSFIVKLSLFNHPQGQRKGIGSRLLKTIEAQFSSSTYELFSGSRSKRNLELYCRLGYSEGRRKQVSPELELVLLQKPCAGLSGEVAL